MYYELQNIIIQTKEKTAFANFWDSPYHLSVKLDTSKLMKWQPYLNDKNFKSLNMILQLIDQLNYFSVCNLVNVYNQYIYILCYYISSNKI